MREMLQALRPGETVMAEWAGDLLKVRVTTPTHEQTFLLSPELVERGIVDVALYKLFDVLTHVRAGR